MRARVAKKFRTLFEKQLRVQYPQFEVLRGEVLPPGCPLFVWRIAPDLWAYLLLLFYENHESVAVEMAWTRNRRLPTKYTGPDSQKDGDVQFRLEELWNERHPLHLFHVGTPPDLLDDDDFFDQLDRPDEEFLPLVDGVVDDILKRFAEYGFPYFVKVAADLGHAATLTPAAPPGHAAPSSTKASSRAPRKAKGASPSGKRGAKRSSKSKRTRE